MQLRRTRLALAATSVTVALALTGCDGSVEVDLASPSEEPSETSSGSATPTATPTPSPSTSAASPSSTPTPAATPSISPSLDPVGPARLVDRLLEADEVPGFNEQYTWREAGTRRSEGTEPFGTCHKFAMTSIGAMRVVTRDYLPADGSTDGSAGHLVAEFADRETARRAYEVLRSWRGQCEEELTDYERADVNPLEPVTVPSGEAGWYLLVYGPPEGGTADEGYFDAQGLALVGNRVTVLELRMVGQDYNYPAGEEPMVRAVEQAAARLG